MDNKQRKQGRHKIENVKKSNDDNNEHDNKKDPLTCAYPIDLKRIHEPSIIDIPDFTNINNHHHQHLAQQLEDWKNLLLLYVAFVNKKILLARQRQQQKELNLTIFSSTQHRRSQTNHSDSLNRQYHRYHHVRRYRRLLQEQQEHHQPLHHLIQQILQVVAANSLFGTIRIWHAPSRFFVVPPRIELENVEVADVGTKTKAATTATASLKDSINYKKRSRKHSGGRQRFFTVQGNLYGKGNSEPLLHPTLQSIPIHDQLQTLEFYGISISESNMETIVQHALLRNVINSSTFVTNRHHQSGFHALRLIQCHFTGNRLTTLKLLAQGLKQHYHYDYRSQQLRQKRRQPKQQQRKFTPIPTLRILDVSGNRFSDPQLELLLQSLYSVYDDDGESDGDDDTVNYHSEKIDEEDDEAVDEVVPDEEKETRSHKTEQKGDMSLSSSSPAPAPSSQSLYSLQQLNLSGNVMRDFSLKSLAQFLYQQQVQLEFFRSNQYHRKEQGQRKVQKQIHYHGQTKNDECGQRKCFDHDKSKTFVATAKPMTGQDVINESSGLAVKETFHDHHHKTSNNDAAAATSSSEEIPLSPVYSSGLTHLWLADNFQLQTLKPFWKELERLFSCGHVSSSSSSFSASLSSSSSSSSSSSLSSQLQPTLYIKSLILLDVSYNSLDSTDLQYILQYFLPNILPELQVLNLSYNSFTIFQHVSSMSPSRSSPSSSPSLSKKRRKHSRISTTTTTTKLKQISLSQNKLSKEAMQGILNFLLCSSSNSRRTVDEAQQYEKGYDNISNDCGNDIKLSCKDDKDQDGQPIRSNCHHPQKEILLYPYLQVIDLSNNKINPDELITRRRQGSLHESLSTLLVNLQRRQEEQNKQQQDILLKSAVLRRNDLSLPSSYPIPLQSLFLPMGTENFLELTLKDLDALHQLVKCCPCLFDLGIKLGPSTAVPSVSSMEMSTTAAPTAMPERIVRKRHEIELLLDCRALYYYCQQIQRKLKVSSPPSTTTTTTAEKNGRAPHNDDYYYRNQRDAMIPLKLWPFVLAHPGLQIAAPHLQTTTHTSAITTRSAFDVCRHANWIYFVLQRHLDQIIAMTR